jgi:DNA gyrase subunit A
VEAARAGLIELLDVDELQASAILNMQLRRLAALERQKIIDDLARIEGQIEEFKAILASPERQRQIISDELAEIVAKYGDERRTMIVPFDGDMSMEDLIPQEDVVVTITRGGYAKRTRVDLYRSQRRGGKGVRGAHLRGDDLVEHFFTTTTHHWLLFFTNLGRVYRAKAYELPEGSRDAKGQHVANLLAFQPGERIAQVLDLRDYEQAPYLVLATKGGLVKKTRLGDYDTNRTAGLIAINLREVGSSEPDDVEADDVVDEGNGGNGSNGGAVAAVLHDELVSARLVSAEDDLLLVSRKGQSLRFHATDDALRPMGRATSGVTGMKFRDGDHLLAMDVVRPDEPLDVFVVFENGLAKRTPVDQYRVQGRGGLGIKVAKLSDKGGHLVGALMVADHDEVLVVMEKGKIVRSRVADVRATGRNTSGVRFATPDRGDAIIGIARNAERADPDEVDDDGDVPADPEPDAGSVHPAERSDGVASDGGHSDDAPRTDGPGAGDGSAEPGGDE